MGLIFRRAVFDHDVLALDEALLPSGPGGRGHQVAARVASGHVAAAPLAWLRILVVRCSLPFPPVGGHSSNEGPRFHRAVSN
jgi:hypothetical protein